MLADRLSRHRKTCAELAERLAVVGAKPIKQLAAARIGQRFEHLIHEYNMQPFSCMSTANNAASKINRGGRTRPIGGVYCWLRRCRMNCCWSIGLLPRPFSNG